MSSTVTATALERCKRGQEHARSWLGLGNWSSGPKLLVGPGGALATGLLELDEQRVCVRFADVLAVVFLSIEPANPAGYDVNVYRSVTMH